MLFRVNTLERIKSGEVTLAFRRWRRPTVKAGGTLHTPIGLLSIKKVDQISASEITVPDARRAGFTGKAELLKELKSNGGMIYRIEFSLAGDDPRIKLRQSNRLSKDEFEKIKLKLDRMDRASQNGPWTTKVLKALEKYPHMAARELAKKTGFDKDVLKINVRKLKNMGLTISHSVGYELSPRGKMVLARLKR